MLYVRIIVGIALVLMAAFGPGVGFRHITNRTRPIRAPRDCTGLRIRTLDSALHQEIFHALGYPATEVANLRPPGDVLPVDTNRPGYLPAVGNGPPPASR